MGDTTLLTPPGAVYEPTERLYALIDAYDALPPDEQTAALQAWQDEWYERVVADYEANDLEIRRAASIPRARPALRVVR